MKDRLVHLASPFPLARVVDRAVDAGFHGPVFVWDVDKTYLETRFSQLKGLAQIPFEFGIDKRAVAGTPELLQALRRGPGGVLRPLHFVSASPYQLADALARKLLLDGVEWDGVTFKNPLRLLVTGHPSQLREQVGFKLTALLLLAKELPAGATLHLFGDDVEHDPRAFALAADVIAGRTRGPALGEVLRGIGVHGDYVDGIRQLADEVVPREAVERLWIRLVRAPDGSRIATFDDRVVGWTSAGALATALEGLGLVTPGDVARVRERAPGGTIVPGAAGRDPAGFWSGR